MEQLTTKPGIYDNISIETYHGTITHLSSSLIKHAKGGIRNFVYQILEQASSERKSHFDFGNAVELAIIDHFTGSKYFDNEVAIANTAEWIEWALDDKPELKSPKASKVYKDAKAAFENANQGKYIINDVGETESYECLEGIIKTLDKDPTVKRLLAKTDYQKTLIWKDEETGMLCKSRPDVVKSHKNVIVDIKTTVDASPQGFSKQVAKFDYPIQAAMQIEGAVKSGLYEEVESYYWLAVEKQAPFNYGIYRFQNADWEGCTDMYHALLKKAARAFKRLVEMQQKGEVDYTDVDSYGLEGYGDEHGIMSLDLPLWYQNTLQ